MGSKISIFAVVVTVAGVFIIAIINQVFIKQDVVTQDFFREWAGTSLWIGIGAFLSQVVNAFK